MGPMDAAIMLQLLYLWSALVGLYILPSAVARGRGLTAPGPVYVVNLLLGWTVLGWVAALAMAVGFPTKAVQPVLQDA